ncbi:MAG: sigma-70 family RNA polymerase sigma factor [Paludibacteraceae bacterium]|jgi:RNA polymerase sigma-70 factor (ECF subfamily)|nr:sigma-70 family RNA polymerase sigma factor [Paludibacteraceae bacterium]MBR5470251.1 sigma-70 family RNA polymerase sigma factor [Paludibacteraceae bacterium]
MTKSLTDEQLIKLLQDEKTKQEAFSQVVLKYQKQLYWQIRKMLISHEDTDDVLQNTLMKAWVGINNFRGDSKLSTWLYRIAVNETLTFLNNQRIKNLSSMLDMEDILLSKLEADSYFDGNEAEAKLQKAILALPDKQRLVFNMKYFEEKTYEEMEEILGTSVGALKASYHHAVKKIEHFLTED